MASWRDDASALAQDDLEELLNATLSAAKKYLETYGEFFPIGASVDRDGTVAQAAGDPGLGEHPPSQDVIDVLVAGFRSQRDLLRATVVVADVLYNGSDAVRFELEHSEGPVITVFVPYTKKRFGRGIEYADMAVTVGTHQVWNR